MVRRQMRDGHGINVDRLFQLFLRTLERDVRGDMWFSAGAGTPECARSEADA